RILAMINRDVFAAGAGVDLDAIRAFESEADILDSGRRCDYSMHSNVWAWIFCQRRTAAALTEVRPRRDKADFPLGSGGQGGGRLCGGGTHEMCGKGYRYEPAAPFFYAR